MASIPSTRHPSRTPSALRYSSFSRHSRPTSASPSCFPTCLLCPSTTLLPSCAVRPPPRDSWQAAPDDACRHHLRFRTPTSHDSERSWRRSLQRREQVTLTRCLPSWIRTWYCGLTKAPCECCGVLVRWLREPA